MNIWKNVILKPCQSMREAIAIIDKAGVQIAIVVDHNVRLLGTVTDGDVRRAILKGCTLETPVTELMKCDPTTAHVSKSDEEIMALMKKHGFRHMPLVDDHGVVMGLRVYEELLDQKRKVDNWVVLMAGGIGSRLSLLTKETPKPMLPVGGKPIIETILENLIKNGLHRFFFSVNYKAEMVKDYFEDGSRWGVEIRYLHEDKKLGTAGALSLLPERPSESLLVMNADLLTNVNFQQLLAFHKEYNAHATMCVREYDFQVPYGVVKINNHLLVGIDEKPLVRFFVNAGIYMLEPDVLELIPAQTYFDMTSLFQKLLGSKREVATFPIREYWLDIGKASDFERANGEFGEVFE